LGYIGSIPADKYQTLQKQSFTTSATDTYTLSYAVTNPQDLALFINNVRQNPNDAYTVSGTTLTLSAAITGSDTMYAVFLGKSVETIAPADNSVSLSKLTATGTKDATTFLRGDNTFATVTSVGGATGVDFNDNVKARFGTGNDLEIYHDASNSYIVENGTGDLYLQANNNVFLQQVGGGETYAKFTKNGSVELYHDNSKKIETTSGGVDVTGALTVNGAALAGGKIAQVVSTTKKDTFSTSSSSFTDISGMSVSITPSSSSSKIFVSVQLCHGGEGGLHAHGKLLRGSSSIAEGNGPGGQKVAATMPLQGGVSNNDRFVFSSAMNYLDSPNTTSSTTYKMQVQAVNFNGNGTPFTLNRPNTNSNDVGAGYYVSTITVMEVLA